MATHDQIQNTTHELWIDGRQMTITLQQNPTDTTQLILTWTAPPATTRTVYNGAIVLVSDQPFDASNMPEDGKRFTASSNWAAPADKIGEAHVVSAFYGYFGDNIEQTTVTVSNTDPTKVYYASVHAASNILQYYSIGVQSYPLESSRFEKSSDAYAGSIPTSHIPPTNPTNGQVYFDSTINRVLVWSGTQLAWIETSDDTFVVSEQPLIQTKQMYFKSDDELRFFIGGTWVTCNNTNTRIKYGASWIPLGNVSMEAGYPETPADGDVIAVPDPRAIGNNVGGYSVKVFTLGQWLNLTSSLIQFQTAPSVWENPVFGQYMVQNEDPKIPKVGDFFYQTSTKDLFVWSDDEWTKADTQMEGTPTTDKIGVGTDGSYDERLRLIKILKGQMGWPQVCVELNEEQFNIAIDNALQTFRQKADNAYAQRFVVMTVNPFQQTYYLNDPRQKTDKIVNVTKIGRVDQLGAGQINDPVYGQLFIPSVYGNPGQTDLVSIHLMRQLSESYERIFAGNFMFTWDEASRQLYIQRNIPRAERVILEVVMERTEQELMSDRYAQQWIQGWAMAELKETLGLIRTKYSAVAGPNGGVTLNGDLLLSEARLDFEDLQRQILDYEVGNGGTFHTNTSFFIM